ncbi:MAG TPA: HEAT repeat domain-containing protein [Planctomycetota bacterium]|nr:HEAT repeat domain-containing protein [Planctomycetota bacterium]
MLTSLLLLALQNHGHIVETDPLPPQEQLKKFKLPPGFRIEFVAAEPDVIKPMNLAFDDRGRLLVTQSVEYPFPAKGAGRDTVRRLSSFDENGRATKVEVYADGLNIPIGVAPVIDGAVAFSIPKVWRFRGVDTVEERRPILGDAGFKDTHGMLNAFTPWVDGWIYACHGFANQTEIKDGEGRSLVMHSGNTWRFRPDGSRAELFTNGQTNPFGLCFDPLGNAWTADCHSKPIYHLLRGAWYPTFGGQHDGLGLAPAVMNHIHGSTGIAGIVYYAASQFPAEYRDTVFVGNPITHRINHDRLERTGTSYKAVERPDFLSCDDPWFRPVDLQLAPDGTLYIADFYTRIIGHYEVPLDHPKREKTYGRIWRIRHEGPVKPLEDLYALDAAALVERLKDETLPVRVKATNQLVERIGKPAIEAVRRGDHPLQRAHGLWVLERLGAFEEADVRRRASDPDPLVRTHAIKAIAERRSWAFETELVRTACADPDPWVRRAAVEALGLHPHRDHLPALLATPVEEGDTHLAHALRIALRNQILLPGVLSSLEISDRIADVCPGAATPDAAAYLLRYLKGRPLNPTYLRHALRHASKADFAAAIETAERLREAKTREQVALTRAVQQGLQERGAAVPPSLMAAAADAVKAALADRGAQNDALKLARELRLPGVYAEVLALARSAPNDVRGNAIDALPALDGARAVADLPALLSEPDAGLRAKAAAALAATGRPDAREALLAALRTASQSTAVQIAAGLAGTAEGADALLKAVEDGKAPRRLLADRTVVGRLQASKAKGWEARVKKLTADLPPEDESLKKLLAGRRDGFAKARPDAERGRAVFAKSCAGCHRVGGQGQKIGPELDGIGHRGLERVLEDVLDPNRAVDAAFRATLIKTTSGEVISGLVLREEGQVLVVQEAADKETRVPLSKIEARVLSQLSPMPANVTEQLSDADFYDLIAFLLAQQPR